MKINKQKYNGFRILIEKNLSEIEELEATNFALSFINKIEQNNGSWRLYSRAGYRSAVARKQLGFILKHNLVFRRISNKKREFAIHKLEHICYTNNNMINIKERCVCPGCMSCDKELKVKWKLEKPDFYLYYETGLV